mmetsp:Transcript_1183/g.2232  ORF Transcript_1183/g.2232 Transcript_1183/m.2232 type:complete len:102 (-) Transcript_1183:828-1133(-)
MVRQFAETKDECQTTTFRDRLSSSLSNGRVGNTTEEALRKIPEISEKNLCALIAVLQSLSDPPQVSLGYQMHEPNLLPSAAVRDIWFTDDIETQFQWCKSI